MKIELRRVTYNARLSQETPAFAADLWIDGVKRGEVQNDGGGGPHMIHPHPLEDEIEAYAKTLPMLPARWGLPAMAPTAEILIGDLLNDHLIVRDLTRALKRKTLLVSKGKLYSVKAPPSKVTVAEGEVVLNLLPFDEALALYRKMTEAA